MNFIVFQSITTQPETITAKAATQSKFGIFSFANDFHKVSNENIVINFGIRKK